MKKAEKAILNIIKEFYREADLTPIEDVIEGAKAKELSVRETKGTIDALIKKGKIDIPEKGFIRYKEGLLKELERIHFTQKSQRLIKTKKGKIKYSEVPDSSLMTTIYFFNDKKKPVTLHPVSICGERKVKPQRMIKMKTNAIRILFKIWPNDMVLIQDISRSVTHNSILKKREK